MKFGEGWSRRQVRNEKSDFPGLSCNLGFGIWSFGFAISRLTLGLLVSLLVGCASGPPRFDQALMADQGAAARNQGVIQAYHVFCPDILEIRIAGQPELSGWRAIDAEGRIDLGRLGKLRVEERSPSQIVQLLSEENGIPADQIQVRVAEYNSQQIYLFGQVMPQNQERGVKVEGRERRDERGSMKDESEPGKFHLSSSIPHPSSQRAVPYRGPETVLDLLQRVGGITPGAAPSDVHVIRSRLAENKPPEVFHIDLQAIVMNQDQSTNLRLQPFDQVFVGEAKRSSLEKCIPPCLRPVYEKLCGIRRPGSFSYDDPLPLQSLKANIAARNASIQLAIFRGAGDEE
jgi:protein involved in polysaccharide export with SLBB domain